MNSPPSPPTHSDFDLAEAALEGDLDANLQVLTMLRAPELAGALKARGATATEAEDILGDMCGDCFGGERAKGGLHRLLGRYNGACPLSAYLRHVAVNRLISLKRKKRPSISTDDKDARELPDSSAPAGVAADAGLIDLLRDALVRALAGMDPEKLVIVRLIESYQIPQKRIGALLGWHETKISRAKSDFLTELRSAIMNEVQKADPWIQLEWDDFVSLCAESSDLFGQ